MPGIRIVYDAYRDKKTGALVPEKKHGSVFTTSTWTMTAISSSSLSLR